jgi:hypothetical protein
MLVRVNHGGGGAGGYCQVLPQVIHHHLGGELVEPDEGHRKGDGEQDHEDQQQLGAYAQT